ncbi:DNA-binding response regulator [Malaciobacter molluscorum LMG 25693]|uniref:DNA-binding response regulator n=1 Tax=Malaciobacter molluscorum LMG 25693 TaxID=870501 RepID=A0A2G1DIN9_9BACT|nr:response regulator transcription factor [Malaciobacter molluscorum]AXX91895.1 two-component system response regulator [Malaciobacter molluscorum LMG 25693]PHO18362.1 DNA-binding response regulator [Malaciobacter molluscorum LMG 25693]
MDDRLFKELKHIPILCVEDEDGIRENIVQTLEYYFDEVFEAQDGNEAFELYEYYKPKIVLTDIQMKNCDGVELIRKIRQIDKDITIFVLTAYSTEEYLLDLINLNINHFIIKPLNLKKLNEALLKYLDKDLKPIELCKGLVLDIEKREVIYNSNEIISLRKREKDFLQLLVKRKNSIVTYDQIEQELWLEKEMTTHALKSFIKDLRSKLPINIIKNIPQEGYTLIKEGC